MNKQHIQQFYSSGVNCIIVVCLLLLSTAKAQNIETQKGLPHLKYYRGIVLDMHGTPLPIVNIEDQNTCITVTSGFMGEFTI